VETSREAALEKRTLLSARERVEGEAGQELEQRRVFGLVQAPHSVCGLGKPDKLHSMASQGAAPRACTLAWPEVGRVDRVPPVPVANNSTSEATRPRYNRNCDQRRERQLHGKPENAIAVRIETSLSCNFMDLFAGDQR
jgi:hypothetical protein